MTVKKPYEFSNQPDICLRCSRGFPRKDFRNSKLLQVWMTHLGVSGGKKEACKTSVPWRILLNLGHVCKRKAAIDPARLDAALLAVCRWMASGPRWPSWMTGATGVLWWRWRKYDETWIVTSGDTSASFIYFERLLLGSRTSDCLIRCKNFQLSWWSSSLCARLAGLRSIVFAGSFDSPKLH